MGWIVVWEAEVRRSTWWLPSPAAAFGYNWVMSDISVNYPLQGGQVGALLRSKQINPTAQRLTIARFLFSARLHLSAEQVLNGVNRDGKTVSRATIYNTLKLFSGKGLLREVPVAPDEVIYDTNLANHYHTYNVDSGELADIAEDGITVSGVPKLPDDCELVGVDLIVRVRAARGSHS